MSRVTKIKHILKEQEADEFDSPKENQTIVRVVASRGNNLHEVETATEVEPIEEGNKVKAEICRILTAEHIKIFEKENVWPKRFTKKRELEDDLDDDGLVRNTNRKFAEENDDSDESESTDEDN
ncbi:probable RNA-binding protein EIF1AD [Wyeomyia smithii]|uniref:probable RNA-binding protein EIF1AD n=1 Tax=Wyeomyia smithii TaxID=174621 RepID=UPI002467DAE7|nr:probable RNA-binding protein EIF1AD [Wyeomyia smithii]